MATPAPANIRVRFAPSPTGEPHIGSVWTALINYVFARQHDGRFILRIEDTDQKRLVPGATEKIIEALSWYGLTLDEGPEQDGEFGPYVQSQRLEIYQQYTKQLVASGNAYYCFCTSDRLEKLRQGQTARKQPPRYDKHCATLDKRVVEARLAGGESAVIRIKLPLTGESGVDDIIRGRVRFAYDQLDDSVILKSDGFPTYHLANVVDDHLMGITHVIRAEEWLPSTPKHLFLYAAFGWAPPRFTHLPLILGSDRSKLSKRHGAVSALSFRDAGYLPEAMVNFLMLMGWHPKGDEEALPLDEMIKQFRLEEMNPSGAIFDRTKLNWLNGLYIRRLPIEGLRQRLQPWWNFPPGEPPPDEWQDRVLEVVRDRMTVLAEVNELTRFLFRSWWDEDYQHVDREMLKPKAATWEQTRGALRWAGEWLRHEARDWTARGLKSAMLAAIAAAGRTNTEVLWPLRVALTLRRASPDVFDILALLGAEESLRRIDAFSSDRP